MPAVQNEDMKNELGKLLAEQCIGIRDRRRVVEEKWLRVRRMWMNNDVEARFMSSDTGSGRYSIPAGRRSTERTVVRGVKLLTPQVKWFDCQPVSSLGEKNAGNTDKYMWYILRKKIKSRSNINQLIRSIFIYGLCHQKTSIMVRNGLVWPTQRAVDPFAYYTYPETSSISDEAELSFEDILMSYERYRTFVKKGIVDEVKRDDITTPNWPYHLVERLAYQGITSPGQNIDIAIEKVGEQLNRISNSSMSLSEVWTSREDKLYQAYILWNHREGPKCVGFIESQYDEPLIRTAIHRGLPGETYTNSMADDIVELDALQNDQLNKFQEAVDFEQGFSIVDAQARHDSWKMKGRAIWLANGNAKDLVTFIQPPVTSTNQLRAWQIYQAMINSFAGAGTIAEGQPGRNMPRAGFAMQSLLEMGMADVQDVAELVEQEVLTPGLSDIYKVSSQFIPPNQLMRVPGGEGIASSGQKLRSVLRRQDILGDYEFDWIGSLQSQDNQARAQQSLIFLNMMPTLAPLLQQQGYAPNIVELMRSIWRDALGERGLSDIIVKITDLERTITEDMQGDGEGDDDVKGEPGLSGLGYNLPSPTNGFVQQK
jgi:hypothetical protein